MTETQISARISGRPANTAPGNEPVVAATDGSSLGNPGPGGWAWYVNDTAWQAGSHRKATNNQMELEAIRQLLTHIPADRAVHIIADSSYAIDALTKWHHGWQRRGWVTSNGKPVANSEQIKTIVALLKGRTVTFEHVRGHRGHPLNEAADQRCREASEQVRVGQEPGVTGPGWPGSPQADDRQDSGGPDSSNDSSNDSMPSDMDRFVDLVGENVKVAVWALLTEAVEHPGTVTADQVWSHIWAAAQTVLKTAGLITTELIHEEPVATSTGQPDRNLGGPAIEEKTTGEVGTTETVRYDTRDRSETLEPPLDFLFNDGTLPF